MLRMLRIRLEAGFLAVQDVRMRGVRRPGDDGNPQTLLIARKTGR